MSYKRLQMLILAMGFLLLAKRSFSIKCRAELGEHCTHDNDEKCKACPAYPLGSGWDIKFKPRKVNTCGDIECFPCVNCPSGKYRLDSLTGSDSNLGQFRSQMCIPSQDKVNKMITLLFCTLIVIGNCMGQPCILRNNLTCEDNIMDNGESGKPVNVHIRVLPIQWVYMILGISGLCLFGLIAFARYTPGYVKDTKKSMCSTSGQSLYDMSTEVAYIRPDTSFCDQDIDDAELKRFGRTEMLPAGMEKRVINQNEDASIGEFDDGVIVDIVEV